MAETRKPIISAAAAAKTPRYTAATAPRYAAAKTPRYAAAKTPSYAAAYAGCKALVMGLGLHGGGLESAKFLARFGAELTVTDTREESALLPSITALDAFLQNAGAPPAKYVLGRHDLADFKKADIILKNPGVPPDSPYIRPFTTERPARIETDISLFLQHNPAVLIGVTGSKGKSFTASALCHALALLTQSGKANSAAPAAALAAKNAAALPSPPPKKSFLGGNITVSPLTFLDELNEDCFVVLELSSFQLGDLPLTARWADGALLKPRAAVLTAIMKDHQDRYGTMEAYIADKKIIYKSQDRDDITVSFGGVWGRVFLSETKGRPLCSCDDAALEALSAVGNHRELNILNALCALTGLEFEREDARRALDSFPGIEHRMELFLEHRGARFYNDSAATIPEAAAACCRSLQNLVLVTGGTDKNLDFTPLADAAREARAVILLAGTGSDKLANLLTERGIAFSGPYSAIEEAAASALQAVKAAVSGCAVALSPGCASFGMFHNEFDRGRKWKAAVSLAVKNQ